jgi:uncharacterized Fe-S cluster-containing MiaB family protein
MNIKTTETNANLKNKNRLENVLLPVTTLILRTIGCLWATFVCSIDAKSDGCYDAHK